MTRIALAAAALALLALGADGPQTAKRSPAAGARNPAESPPMRINRPVSAPPRPSTPPAPAPNVDAPPAQAPAPATAAGLPLTGPDLARSATSVGLFLAASMAPAAVLMVTAFVRINIVLLLLRQALGSPQVPGNQVLSALALLLTALAMRPEADAVYRDAIGPLSTGAITPAQAWEAGSKPIKAFMVNQIVRTNNQACLWELYDAVEPPTPARVDPQDGMEFPLRVVAPAFLLSELKTAFLIGFGIYLPFLVVDLVVSAVLAAMGLFLLPPTLVAMPIKLILFVLADGWLLVSTMLLRSVSG